MKNLRTMNGVTMTKKSTKSRAKTTESEIPEGYISSEEFFKIFKEKLIAAYENQ